MEQKISILSDTQAKYHDKGALALVLYALKKQKPEIVILNGDIIDCFAISDFNRSFGGPDSLMEEWAVAYREVILPIREAVPNAEIIWVEGNHEDRYTNRLYSKLQRADLGEIYGMLPSLEEFFKLKKHGIKYIKSKRGNGKYDLIPKVLTVMHGSLTGVNALRNTLKKHGNSVVISHTHKSGSEYIRLWNGEEIVGFCTGCLCEVEPEYSDTSDWTQSWISGWIDVDAKRFGLNHEKIITLAPHHKELVSGTFGRLKALRDKGGKWAVKRIS